MSIRRLAQRLNVTTDAVLAWLLAHGHAFDHPAHRVPMDVAEAVALALVGRPIASGGPTLADDLKERGILDGSERARVRDLLSRQLGGNPDVFDVAELSVLVDDLVSVACDDEACAAELAIDPGRALLARTPDAAYCDLCAGSDNRRAVARMVRQCRIGGVKRLLVVGGAPTTVGDLVELCDGRIDLRVIDGLKGRTRGEAQGDLAWANLCVVWGATPLAHKVSELYTDRWSDKQTQVIVVRRRGVAALCEEVVVAASRRSA